MTTLPDLQPIPSDLSDRTVTLSLNLCGADVVTVRSCEVIGRWFRNRVSFQEQRSIEDILVARLAQAVRSCLRRLPEGAHVLALPEFLVELPGLALSGVHVMVMDAKQGSRSAILRFKEFIGSVNNAFLMDIGLQEPCPSHSEKLAVNVLEDICLPILNMCRDLNDTGLGSTGLVPQHVADRAREFEFQTELLKRYIHNAGLQHQAASGYASGGLPRTPSNFIVD